MQLFGGDQRKACVQIKPHLMPENRTRARACPVTAVSAGIENEFEEVVVCLHPPQLADSLATSRVWPIFAQLPSTFGQLPLAAVILPAVSCCHLD
jgi:hypothetical protein